MVEDISRIQSLLREWAKVGKTPGGRPIKRGKVGPSTGDPAWCPPEIWGLIVQYGIGPVTEATIRALADRVRVHP